MNRTIKFRAWDKQNGMQPVSAEDLQSAEWNLFVPNAILMQFTGLHDRNGKEIYEGDIVKIYKDYDNKVVATMRWLPAWADPSIRDSHSMNESEIIGNIYENPNLLEEPKP